MVQPDAGQLLYDLAELCISPGDDMKRLNLFSVAAVLALAASSANASDVDALMENCNGCHGDGGVSQSSDVPTIGWPRASKRVWSGMAVASSELATRVASA